MNHTARKVYDFRGAGTPPAAGSPNGGPFVNTTTASSGSPTIAPAGGAMVLTLDNTSEPQNICLSMDNVLAFDINDLIRVEILAKASADLDSSITAIVGLASARNDDPDAIAAGLFFKLAGSNALLVETDDGTNDNNDVATGVNLVAAYKRLVIDFADRNHTQSAPSQSLGGLANVGFRVSNANGNLAGVARNTRFDVSNYSSGLQLIAQLQKTTGTAVGSLSILEMAVEYKVR